MPNFLRLLLCALAVSGALAQPAARSGSPAETEQLTRFQAPLLLITHAQLIDGRGGPPQPDMAVLVREGRIERIAPAAELKPPPGARVEDLQGGALLPGFVLLHEHLFYPVEAGSYGAMFRSFPLLYLAGGVTTLRTGGSLSPYADLNARREIESGQAAGPDMDTTAPFLNGPLAYIAQLPQLKDAEDARRLVEYWSAAGSTSYKAYMHLTREQLGAAIQAAHARGAAVTAHLCAVGYREAAALGIDNLEHGFFVASDFVADKQPDLCPAGDAVQRALNALPVDAPAMRELQRELIARQVAITSTLTIFETYAAGRPMAAAGALALLHPTLREQYLTRWAAVQRGGPNVWAALFPKAMAWELQYHRGGGLLVAGTDPTGYGGVVPGYSSLRQLELLQEAGFPLGEAVQVMTLNGARYLGRAASVGSIEAGKRADLVAFAKPLATQAPLPEMLWSMKAGRAFDRGRFLQMWQGQVGLR